MSCLQKIQTARTTSGYMLRPLDGSGCLRRGLMDVKLAEVGIADRGWADISFGRYTHGQ